MPNLANHDYVRRINRAIDYITGNIGKPLDLNSVAKVACFSPHHFHRIFHALVGETLNSFIKRVRLERAIDLMSHRREFSLTDIALRCGFSSSSDFSRCFRGAYGVPPSLFDVSTHRRMRRADFSDSVKLTGLPCGENPDNFSVRIRNLPRRRVAYIRVMQPYEGDGVVVATKRLISWAKEWGLAGGQWLGYQWDDPEVVPVKRCRPLPGLALSAPSSNTTSFPASPAPAA